MPSLRNLLSAAGVKGVTKIEFPEGGSITTVGGTNTYTMSCCYDPTNNKVIIAYRDGGNSNYGTAVVGTITGTVVTLGTPTVFNSGATSSITMCYDITNSKIVITYSDVGNTSYGTAIVGTVSGTGISFGAESVFNSANTSYIQCCYDSANSKVVIAYRDVSPYYGTAIVGTVASTSISFGAKTVFNSAQTNEISCCYDTFSGKTVVTYKNVGNSEYGTAIVGTVSGTGISFGTAVIFNSASSAYTNICYDSINHKVVISYKDGGNSDYGTAIVGTVANTSISFGAESVYNTGAAIYPWISFDSTTGKVIIMYRDDTNSSYGTTVIGTVSNTSISFGTKRVFHTGDPSNCQVCCYGGYTFLAYSLGGASYRGAVEFGKIDGTNLVLGRNVLMYSGFAYESYCYDSTGGKIVIVWRDDTNSYYGTVIVGTISGNTITFGTKTVFNAAHTEYPSCCYDSTNQKVVIIYQESNFYGSAIVGTISGNAITFGAETVFNAANTDTMSCCYDSFNGKVVVAYTDAGNSAHGTAVVGTVSGTGISFGAEYEFWVGTVSYFISTCYDSTNHKVIIVYNNNNSGAVAKVGTVSGNAISFGAETLFSASASTNYCHTCYDSGNNRVLISYKDSLNSNYGTAVVGTVSGTGISFGSNVVYCSGASYYNYCCYDSNDGVVFITYMNNGSSNKGNISMGTISGTSIVFKPAVVFDDNNCGSTMCIYDNISKKVAIVYNSGTYSWATSLVGTPA